MWKANLCRSLPVRNRTVSEGLNSVESHYNSDNMLIPFMVSEGLNSVES